MAEGFAKALNKDGNYDIQSAGISAVDGDKVSESSVAAMKDFGIDISGHKARYLSSEMMQKSDLVLTMTAFQCEFLRNKYPEYAEKIFAMSNSDVSDPYGQDEKTYKKCAEEIKAAVDAVFEKLKNDKN